MFMTKGVELLAFVFHHLVPGQLAGWSMDDQLLRSNPLGQIIVLSSPFSEITGEKFLNKW